MLANTPLFFASSGALLLMLAFIAAAVALAWLLIAHDRGQKEPIFMLWLAVGFGVAGAFMTTILESRLVHSEHMQPGTSHALILSAALTIGVIEEACKFIPLALLLYKQRYFNEHTDGVIYFALAGLGFGVPENILYTQQFGVQAGLARLLLTPLFHAAATGVIGYFLISYKLKRKSPWRVVMPLGTVMVLHGLYDFGLTTGSAAFGTMSLMITLGLSSALFVAYVRATQKDQDMGLSAVGHNSFCRTCGWANPKHHLYCVHCGKNA